MTINVQALIEAINEYSQAHSEPSLHNLSLRNPMYYRTEAGCVWLFFKA